jgi:hypothetical protein
MSFRRLREFDVSTQQTCQKAEMLAHMFWGESGDLVDETTWNLSSCEA